MAAKQKEKLLSVSFIILSALSFFGMMSGNGINNGVSALVEIMGAPARLAGINVACFSVTALILRCAAGNLSDKYGRRIIIAIGCVLMLVGCIFALIVANIYLIIPARIAMGFGFSMVITASVAAVADVVPKSRVGEALGYQGLAGALAMAVGPSVAVTLVVQGGKTALFVVFSAIALVMLLLTFCCKYKKVTPPPVVEVYEEEEGNAAARFAFKLIEKKALPAGIGIALCAMGLSIFMTFLSSYLIDWSATGVSAFFIVAAVVMILVRVFCAKLFDRYPTIFAFIPSVLFGILGFVCLMVFHSMAGILIAGVCYGFFNGIVQPLLTADAIKRSPSHRRGAASATYYIGMDLGMTIGPLLWGIVIDGLGFNAAFIGGILFLVAAIIFAVFFLREDKIKKE